jgi:CheY-like chemotaxis protein
VFNIEQTFVSAGLTIAETFIYLKTSPLAEFSAHPAAFHSLSWTFRPIQKPGAPLSTASSILTVSRDRVLQETRTLILERAGYSVSAALNDKDAVGFIEAPNDIRLVLMCHSVPEASRKLLVTRIKALKPTLPILMLYNGYDPTEAKVDGSLHSFETPEAMLDMVGFMTRNIGDHL